ncbi:serine hydrolase [Flavobacterium sp.]|uniref:serine hydrolase n=1 Tax=Flavobacterium sp. TaxID=239 RepID=UPI00286D8BD4|nr:serine hydrolase [Flavobacterium sp.]
MKTKSIHSIVKSITLSIVVLLITTNVSIGQNKTSQIDKLMIQFAEYNQFNGSVLVAEQGKIIYKKGFGMANIEWNIPNNPDTKHRLGSISKQFTALLIIQLVEQGKLKLDAPISLYLPDYPKTTGDIITVHHLLTHTSGIPNYTSFPNFFKEVSRNPFTPEVFVKQFSDLPLQFKPGEKFAYSNSGYFLLGHIIEKVSGKSFEKNLHESIFTPLKMNNTGYDSSSVILKNRASGYEKKGNGYENAPYIDMSIPYAAGSLYSTVEDLYLWDQALYNNQLLSSKSMELLFGSYISTGKGSYGYGWNTNEVPNGNDKLRIIEHGGGINGFNTVISRIPSDKNLVILLNNTGSTNLGEMNKAIRNILYDLPFDAPKMSLANALLNEIKEKGLTSGLEKLKELKKSDKYSIKESEINDAGYQFLQIDKVTEAIEFFKINIENFPKSGNAYDSLGEAYLKSGNKILAIENYKKSVELDPKNENGKKIIEEISK